MTPRFSRATVYDPPPFRVREDGLSVREADEHEQTDDDTGDSNDVADCRETDGAAKDEEDLVRRVRHGGDGVGREDGESGFRVETLVLEALTGERPAEDEVLEAAICGGHVTAISAAGARQCNCMLCSVRRAHKRVTSSRALVIKKV
jgi:hypothetical protein